MGGHHCPWLFQSIVHSIRVQHCFVQAAPCLMLFSLTKQAKNQQPLAVFGVTHRVLLFPFYSRREFPTACSLIVFVCSSQGPSRHWASRSCEHPGVGIAWGSYRCVPKWGKPCNSPYSALGMIKGSGQEDGDLWGHVGLCGSACSCLCTLVAFWGSSELFASFVPIVHQTDQYLF